MSNHIDGRTVKKKYAKKWRRLMNRKVTETTSNNSNDENSSSHDLERATETSPFYSNKTVTTTAYEIVCAGPIL